MFESKTIKLAGVDVFGLAVFKPPFKASSALKDEARFVTVLHGQSRLFVPNGQLDIRTSDSFLMKCESFVNNWLPNEDESPNRVFVVQLIPEVLRIVYDDRIPDLFSNKAHLNPDPAERIEMNAMIRNFVDSMLYYLDHPAKVSEDFVKIKVRELVHILLNSDDSGKVKTIFGDLFKSNQYEFKEIIHSHLYEDLNIQDLAFFAGLSLSTFKRKFKEVFGTSPTRYIKTKRLEKAENLLKTTDLRISDIAYDSGFNDIAYFSKAFSAAYQHSPSEYRKIHLT